MTYGLNGHKLPKIGLKLLGLRTIIPDINGTDRERRCFHAFRIAVEENGLPTQGCAFVPFFARMCPQISHQEDAVKHAIVALGAAYEYLQVPRVAVAAGSPMEKLEHFTVEQYTRSLSNLQKNASRLPLQDTRLLVLVCCLSFLFLETMRGNRSEARTHLVNGLNIINGLPDSSFGFLNDLSADPERMGSGSKTALEDVIHIFGKLEIFGCFFDPGFEPVIALRAYHIRRFYSGHDLVATPSLSEAHVHATNYFRDVVGRLHEISSHIGDVAFWSQPVEHMHQRVLTTRTDNIVTLFDLLKDTPSAPRPGSDDFFSLQLDLLHICCARILLHKMEKIKSEALGLIIPTFSIKDDLRHELQHVINLAHQHALHTPVPKLLGMLGFASDADIVGLLYYVAVQSGDQAVAARAGLLLYEVNSLGGGYWDGTALSALAEIAADAIN
ncbi:hypothetical protein PT974_01564 [Cladobotryum mycophilum]|uniref:C6 zinc finger domain protein n=1 Tax=Cladobotryum mycophilum TaxID=491253 RepID=A0ABR0T4B5_9HYPO